MHQCSLSYHRAAQLPLCHAADKSQCHIFCWHRCRAPPTGGGGALHRRHRSLSWNASKPQVGIRKIHANRPRNIPAIDCAGRRWSQSGSAASLRAVLSRRLRPGDSIQRLCCRRLKIPNTRPRPTRVDGAFLHSEPVFCVCY